MSRHRDCKQQQLRGSRPCRCGGGKRGSESAQWKSPSSGRASTPAASNEGATIARRLATVLVKPGVDSSLDCELGIMRALTERNQQATDIPIELMRDWTLVAVQRRDCGLLGRAMALASAAGHSMAGLLGGFGSLTSVLCEITSVYNETGEARKGSSSTSSEDDAEISDGSSTASSPTPPCPLLPMGAAGAPPQSGLPSLPVSMCWLHDQRSCKGKERREVTNTK